MKKRTLVSLVLLAILLLSMIVTAYAAEERATHINADLIYSGTTANCTVLISSPGDEIEATVELWRGSVCLSRWAAEAEDFLEIDESRQVLSGSTYVMTVNGSIDGVPFDEVSITKRCP